MTSTDEIPVSGSSSSDLSRQPFQWYVAGSLSPSHCGLSTIADARPNLCHPVIDRNTKRKCQIRTQQDRERNLDGAIEECGRRAILFRRPGNGIFWVASRLFYRDSSVSLSFWPFCAIGALRATKLQVKLRLD